MVTPISERTEFVAEFWAAFAWTPVHQGSDGIRVAFASITPIIAKKRAGSFRRMMVFVHSNGQYGG